MNEIVLWTDCELNLPPFDPRDRQQKTNKGAKKTLRTRYGEYKSESIIATSSDGSARVICVCPYEDGMMSILAMK